MLDAVYIWESKYGVPKDSSYEGVSAFVQKLQDQPEAIHNDLCDFAQSFETFFTEAKEFYPDDRAITINEGFSYSYHKDETNNAVLMLDDKPSNCDNYYDMLYAYANKYNLIYCDGETGTIFKATDTTKADKHITEWQEKLAELKKAPREDDEYIPDNTAKVTQLLVKLLKKRLAELNIPNYSVKNRDSSGLASAYIETGIAKIELSYMFEHDIGDDDFRMRRIILDPYMYIYIYINNQREEFRFDHQHFYKDEKINLSIDTVAELKQGIEYGIVMMQYFYPHLDSLESLYTLLSNAENDERLSEYMQGSTVYIVCPITMYLLAYATKQPNLPALREKYKQLSIGRRMRAIKEEYRLYYLGEEAKKAQRDPNYEICEPNFSIDEESELQEYTADFERVCPDYGEGDI